VVEVVEVPGYVRRVRVDDERGAAEEGLGVFCGGMLEDFCDTTGGWHCEYPG
jgi:hypothetical protein